MKVEISKGVLGKDGSPFAAGTLCFVDNGYVSPVKYSMTSLGLCLARLAEGQITAIELIDEDNNQFIISND